MATAGLLDEYPELMPFVLSNVRPTGIRIGAGAYGTVEEVVVPGAICVAKNIRAIFLDRSLIPAAEIRRARAQFVRECELMSTLHHPNIVQFLGIFFFPGSQLPALVMERMLMTLHSLLDPETDPPPPPDAPKPFFPLSLKCSILHNVACGLAHLHERSPPIIHRDLSARNVLLNSGMVAKIADLGVARIVPRVRAAATMTKGPGAPVYMAPEASAPAKSNTEKSKYDASIDVFSLGVVTIFTIGGVFPSDPLEPNYYDKKNGMLLARTELQRRSEYMRCVNEQLRACGQLHGDHPLIRLIQQCLHNLPVKRPGIREVLHLLEEARAGATDNKWEEIQSRCQGVERELQGRVQQLQKENADLLSRNQVKDRELAETLQQLRLKESELTRAEETNRRHQQKLQQKEEELQSSERDKLIIRQQLMMNEAELAETQQQLRQKREQLQSSEREKKTVRQRLTRKERELAETQQQLREKEEQLRSSEALVADFQKALQQRDSETLRTKTQHSPLATAALVNPVRLSGTPMKTTHFVQEDDEVKSKPSSRLSPSTTNYSIATLESRHLVEKVTGAMKSKAIHWQTETEKPLDRSLHNEWGRYAEQQMRDNKSTKERVDEIISVKIHDLVSVLDRKSQLFSTSELKVKFEEQWEEWIKSLASQTPTIYKPYNIVLEIEGALQYHFRKQLCTLKERITPSEGYKSLQCWGRSLHLKLEKEHIKMLSIYSIIVSMIKFTKDESWRPLAELETSHYLHEVEKYLMSKRNKDYNPSFITEIIILLQENVERFRSDLFKFTLEYRMDLTLTACGYALRVFQQMAERYRDENDPVKCLEREKPQYFNDFCDEYSKTAKEIIAARQCCELIERAIEKRVTKSLCLTVVEKMEGDKVNSFLFTKRILIQKVLICIGSELREGKFDTCSEYLRHPMETLQRYVKKFTESYCDDGYPQSRLTIYADELIISNMEFVRETVNEMSDNNKPLRVFIEELISKLSQRLIIDGTIRCELRGKGNISNFIYELKKKLQKVEGNIKQKFVLQAKDMDNWDEKPYDMIFERVRGCKEMCPFCHEPCNQTVANHHGNHTVDLHRPACLGGKRYRSTRRMCLINCSQYIADNYPSADSHPYRECERVYQKWHIKEGLPTEASLYWKYVVAHFKSQLAELYGMEEDDVPPHWMGIELTQAIQAL